jgi:nitroreductase
MAICKTKAVQVDGISYDKELFELPGNRVNHEDFMNFLSNRRSVRNFEKDPVPDELIEKIISSIHFAPFGSHPEKVEITVINDRAIIDSSLPYISQFLTDIISFIENPVKAFFMKKAAGLEDFNTVKNHLYPIAKSGNYKLENGDQIARGAPALIIFHAHKEGEAHSNNSLIYATYAMLAAHSLNLGATMIEVIPAAINRVKEVRNIFQIPKENEAVMSLVLGFPKYKYKRAIKRAKQRVQWIR